ncbi:MAG: hypothetical protein DCF28_10380, partial [Alphaproteobacteria bacterium]
MTTYTGTSASWLNDVEGFFAILTKRRLKRGVFFLFLEPRYTFEIGSPTDILTLIVFWAVASVTGGLAGRVRDQARNAQRRASAVSALLAASQALSAAEGKLAIATVLAEQTAAAAGAKAVVLLPQEGDIALAAGAPVLEPLGAAAMAAARWAWERPQ